MPTSACYYSPEMERFISEDPIGLMGGVNYFAYVVNSPCNFTDPMGLWKFIWGGSWRAIFGGGQEGSVFVVPSDNRRLKSKGCGAGFNVGGSIEWGALLNDDLSKASGDYNVVSYSFLFFSGTIILNAEDEVIGLSGGFGIGLPYGVSISGGETKIDYLPPETYEDLLYENVNLVH